MTRSTRSTSIALFLLLFGLMWLIQSADAQDSEPHRATNLGNPATRFADPLKTQEDLRRTFLKESLQADIAKILRMSDYLGDIEDFRQAVANAGIEEISIPVGTLLPAMSTRKKGQPVLLRNVLWAGKKPFKAYAFNFISLDRRYRVIVPKACSNFWVEEQLPRPLPTFDLSCVAHTESLVHKTMSVCNTLINRGEVSEALAMLSMQIPTNARLDSVTGEPMIGDAGDINWKISDFAPGSQQTLCANFTPAELGPISIKSAATGKRANDVIAQCDSQIFGVPAVLLEVIDLADPVLVGYDVVYAIRVLNQGSIPLTNIKIVARLEENQRYLSGTGATEVMADNEFIMPGVVPLLNPKEQVEWRIVVKAEQAGDVRFTVGLHADQFSRPILETEATFQY